MGEEDGQEEGEGKRKGRRKEWEDGDDDEP